MAATSLRESSLDASSAALRLPLYCTVCVSVTVIGVALAAAAGDYREDIANCRTERGTGRHTRVVVRGRTERGRGSQLIRGGTT